jgi:hypothetical protein
MMTTTLRNPGACTPLPGESLPARLAPLEGNGSSVPPPRSGRELPALEREVLFLPQTDAPLPIAERAR